MRPTKNSVLPALTCSRRCVLLAALCVAASGCGVLELFPRTERSLLEKRVQMPAGTVERFPFTLRARDQVRLEITHLGGGGVSLIVADRAELSEFDRNRQRLSHFSALAHSGLKQRFDSGWQAVGGSGEYVLVMWSKKPSDSSPASESFSQVNLRILSR